MGASVFQVFRLKFQFPHGSVSSQRLLVAAMVPAVVADAAPHGDAAKARSRSRSAGRCTSDPVSPVADASRERSCSRSPRRCLRSRSRSRSEGERTDGHRAPTDSQSSNVAAHAGIVEGGTEVRLGSSAEAEAELDARLLGSAPPHPENARKVSSPSDAAASSAAGGPNDSDAAAARTSGFKAALQRLRARAEAEERGEKPARPRQQAENAACPLPVSSSTSCEPRPAAAFRRGDIVRLHGLKAAPHLNGLTGTCEEWEESSGRWKVRLSSSDETKAVKLDNLVIESAAPTSLGTGDEQSCAASSCGPNVAEPASRTSGRPFEAALQKLREKAEAEERGEKPARASTQACSQRYGVGDPREREQREKQATSGAGRYHPADFWEIPREPIAFVTAEEPALAPSRKVVVVDPRRQGKPEEDRDSSPEPEIGRIVPPVAIAPKPQWRAAHYSTSTWSSSVSSSWTESAAATSSSADWCSSPAGVAPTSTIVPVVPVVAAPVASASPAPPVTSAAMAPVAAAPSVFEVGGREPHAEMASVSAQTISAPSTSDEVADLQPAGGSHHLTATFSDTAREEDRAARDVKEKRRVLDESKRIMLDKLTKQLQTCLAHVQSGSLDERAREKYQDIIMQLKSQMVKVTGEQ